MERNVNREMKILVAKSLAIYTGEIDGYLFDDIYDDYEGPVAEDVVKEMTEDEIKTAVARYFNSYYPEMKKSGRYSFFSPVPYEPEWTWLKFGMVEIEEGIFIPYESEIGFWGPFLRQLKGKILFTKEEVEEIFRESL